MHHTGYGLPRENPPTEAEIRTVINRAVMEAADNFIGLVGAPFDQLDLFNDMYGPWAYSGGQFVPPYYWQSQKRGEVIPIYLNELQLRWIRDRQRRLCTENPYAQAVIANMQNYCVGETGLAFEAVPAHPRECTPSHLYQTQRIIDVWEQANDVPEYANHLVETGIINGDAVTRHFPQDDGIVFMRPVEAEHIKSPTGTGYDATYDFGVQTVRGDTERVEGYWIVENPLENPNPVFVPAAHVTFLKWNTPRSAKRGLPLFHSTEVLLRGAVELLRATMATVTARAKISMIRKFNGVVKDAAAKLVQELSTQTVTDPGNGQTTSMNKMHYGTILNSGGAIDYEFPAQNFETNIHQAALSMVLRAIAVRAVFPEWMITGDPSSGTYDNAFIAESPSTKSFGRYQEVLCRRIGSNRHASRSSMAWVQVKHAVKVGLLPEDVLHTVQIETTGPTLKTRDEAQEAATNKIYCDMRIKSPQTIQAELGLDPKREEANFKEMDVRQEELAKRQLSMQQAMAAAPTRPDEDAGGDRGGPPDDGRPPEGDGGRGSQDRAPAPLREQADDRGPESLAVDTEDLAHFYAELFGKTAPEDLGDAELATVDAELRAGDHVLDWDAAEKTWRVVSPAAQMEAALMEAVHRAPKGGVSIQGKKFRGGQFIPAGDYAKASPAEKEAIDNPAKASADKRRVRGIDAEKLRERLKGHAHHELTAQEKVAARRSLQALTRHHGDLTEHRLEELADRLQAALEETPESSAAQRLQLSRRLKAIEHQLDLVGEQRKAQAPWKGGVPNFDQVYDIPTEQIHVDPERFQFKLNTDRSGVTDEFKAVKKFDPEFAGLLLVWKDPADGKTYAINGHHRHELATRTGHPSLAVRYIDARTANEARARGALANIAEGRGTAVDAAKFMRESGVSIEDIEKRGISVTGKIAAEAAVLVKLNDRLFDRVARGKLDQTAALAVAKHLDNPDLQDQLVRLLDKREDQNKATAPKVIEEMAREMAATPTTERTEHTLFGDITSEDSLFTERNEIKANVRAELSKEVNDFLAVASKRRAERVKDAGNVLDTERNRQEAEAAEQVRGVFDTLVNRKGAISDRINQAAANLAKAKTKGERNAVYKQALEGVRDAVFAEAGVGKVPSDAGGKGTSSPGSGSGPSGDQGPPAGQAAGNSNSGGDPAHGLKASHIKAAKRGLANQSIGVKGDASTPLFKSDLSGEMIRRHVELPGGRRIHPDELHRAVVSGDQVSLGPDENLDLRDPLNSEPVKAKNFADALRQVTAYNGRDDDPVTLETPHGYAATMTRGEWRQVAGDLGQETPSMAAWYDRVNPALVSEAAKQSRAKPRTELAGDEETGEFFRPPAEQGKLFRDKNAKD